MSRRTSIPLHNQELLYEGRRLLLDPNRQAKTFPKTSRDNPIMLVSRESVATVGLIFEDRTSLPVSLNSRQQILGLIVCFLLASQPVLLKFSLVTIWTWTPATQRCSRRVGLCFHGDGGPPEPADGLLLFRLLQEMWDICGRRRSLCWFIRSWCGKASEV